MDTWGCQGSDPGKWLKLLDVYIRYAYILIMIVSFGDKETELIYNQGRSRRIPIGIQARALVKLILLDSAETERDLQIPPSNRFERLKGSRNGLCSIRINDQWRIIFAFDNGRASDVCIVDYH